MNPKHIVWPALIALGLSSPAAAHNFDDPNFPEGFSTHLAVAAAYRSEPLVKGTQRWNIPGTLMGGEAFPSEAGFALDEAWITPTYRNDDAYVLLKFGKHLGSDEFELDHVLVGYQLTKWLAVEAGKLPASFTPFNGEHTSDTSFSSRRLVYDAFWGGQYTDQGARLRFKAAGLDAGLEGWKGDSFPARDKDSNKSAFDAYARYTAKTENWDGHVGLFYYRTDAFNRDDDRYSTAHSHSPTVVTVDPTYFDGKVETKGGYAQTSWNLSQDWSFGLLGEVSQIQQTGRLWDATHTADFRNRSLGLWGEAFVRLVDEKLSFRSERIKVKNDLSGPAALTLAQKLSLQGADEDPYRYTTSYEHIFAPSFRARAEWSRDFSTRTKRDIYIASAVWADTIFHIRH